MIMISEVEMLRTLAILVMLREGTITFEEFDERAKCDCGAERAMKNLNKAIAFESKIFKQGQN